MLDFLSSTVGAICFGLVAFIAGALIGAPLWSWIKTKLPFMK